ncbi:hypothetical protein D3C72_1735150 [compost metagenome]
MRLAVIAELDIAQRHSLRQGRELARGVDQAAGIVLVGIAVVLRRLRCCAGEVTGDDLQLLRRAGVGERGRGDRAEQTGKAGETPDVSRAASQCGGRKVRPGH